MQKEDTDNQLINRNMKPTAMRELVLNVLMTQQTAVSLADLEKMFDIVDRVTLYRTLKTFEKNRLIHSIDDGTGSLKYALCHRECNCDPEDLHVHFHCTKCRKTYCLNNSPIPAVNLPTSFDIETINMVVKGLCANCNKRF